MPRRWLKQFLPDPDSLREQRLLRFMGPRLLHPALWHLNRRSVAGGVAAGLFCGLIPGPLQMLGAAGCAIGLRVNLPIALATTLYTNPFTIVPLYLLAYQIGLLVLPGQSVGLAAPPVLSADIGGSIAALSQWMASLGSPLLVGIPLLAALLAAIGYVFVRVVWGAWLRHTWHRRHAR